MFKKIFVFIDGFQQVVCVLIIVVWLVKSQGVQVVGVYVIDLFFYIGIGDVLVIGLQVYLIEVKLVVGQVLDVLGKVCVDEGVFFVGDIIECNVVYEGILEIVEVEGCDFVVMGLYGCQGIKVLILGSVVQKVFMYVKVLVLIVKF